MAGIDDNVAIIGDWMPPSPSPRAFFSDILGDDISSRSITGHPSNKRTEGLFLGPLEQMPSTNSNRKDVTQSGAQLTESGPFSEQRTNSRGGLVERMAARAGFNAPRLNTESIRSADLSLNQEVESPYLTMPPGLSPTTLLESPVFLSNSLAQPSPTTGKFSFFPNGNSKSLGLDSEPPDKSKDNFFSDINTSSFAFKPVAELGSSFFLGATCKQSFPSIEVSVQSEIALPSHGNKATKIQHRAGNTSCFSVELSRSTPEKYNGVNAVTDRRVYDSASTGTEHSPPLEEQLDEEGEQRACGESMLSGGGGAPSEDGYNWRKYGQKQVKGSEYPRSYYKCTHPNCPVKKKVECSHEGHITEITYKGVHNHPKPPPPRSAVGSLSPLMETQLDGSEQVGIQPTADIDRMWGSTQKGMAAGTCDWRHDNVEVTSSASIAPEFGSQPLSLHTQNGAHFESGDAIDASSTFSNDEDDDDQGTHGSIGYEGEEDESESKRRKIETYPPEMGAASRAIREPRVVVQTTSEVDILDDGYRWRKYGQKVVKGNPNPRSYYKCTSAGCTVRKHVERASHDLKSVITTYEGKHNHDVPAARNSSHVNSGTASTTPAQAATPVQTHAQMPESSQVHSNMNRFDRSAAFGSFNSLPGRQHLGPMPSFSFGMNPPGMANLAMAGLCPGQARMPVNLMPVHPYLAQQCPVNEMGFILPKGEPKVEPLSEPSLNLANNPAVYQQMIIRLPQM